VVTHRVPLTPLYAANSKDFYFRQNYFTTYTSKSSGNGSAATLTTLNLFYHMVYMDSAWVLFVYLRSKEERKSAQLPPMELFALLQAQRIRIVSNSDESTPEM
jgi:hypothetical protein